MKSEQAFRTISEVAGDLDVPQHVLRFWESRFNQLKPLKRGGNRRYYRPEDIELLKAIHQHLYSKGYTIKGVQRLLKDNGPRSIIEATEISSSAAGTASLFESASTDTVSADGVDKKQVGEALSELKAIRALLD